ncbi:MAG: MurR/RpiR family transcriptional regulator [Ruminococcaceae bacterium]|nr:MurR/RpiR family transcriptional regulator [Oscillospiraceae bacterium]
MFQKLKANLAFYSSVEKRIADLILADPKTFISYSMAELSDVAGVSQGSINNFAKKMVNSGFTDLKLQIAQQMTEFSPKPFSLIERGDGIKDVLQKSIHEVTTAFSNTAELNGEGTLQRVVDIILNARNIDLYGIMQSGIIATDFYSQLMQLGLSAKYVNDVLMCPVSASMLNEQDLVIAISTSGKTKDVLDGVKIAKKNGVTVIGMTRNPNSPLAKLSDEVLLITSSGSSISTNTPEIRLSALFLIDSLCAYLRSKLGDRGEERYFKMSEILNTHSVND